MDVQAEKLLLIEKLLQVKNSEVLEKVKVLLESEELDQSAFDLKGYTISDESLQNRANEANEAIERGEYKSVSQLRKETKSW